MFMFIVYITFVLFAVNNVIIAIFTQHAFEFADKDNDVVVQELLKQKQQLLVKLTAICTSEFDECHTGMLLLEDFQAKMECERLKAWFESIDITMEDGFALFKVIDVEQEGIIEIGQFVDGCLRVKGNAKKLDIHQILYDQKRILQAVATVDAKLNKAVDARVTELNSTMGTESEEQEGRPAVSGTPRGASGC
jgi:hypothetical protein